MTYDVTTITVRPGMVPAAIARLGEWLAAARGELLACWYGEIGAVNRILVIRAGAAGDPAERESLARSADPFGLGDALTGWSADTYASFPFVEPMKPGAYGPFFEVRSYVLKPGGLAPTIELWRRALPGRAKLSPALAVMHSLSGAVPRHVHIWPWPSLDARQRIRAQAVESRVWPPAGGGDHLLAQQVDIYLPAPISPIR